MNKETAGGGVGFFGLLTILFIALKLTGVIDWPWLLVLSPLLVSIAVGLLIVIVVFIVAFVKEYRR